MSIDENGFLGEDALKFSEQIRERQKALFECCYEVNRFAQKLKYELVIHTEYPQELFAAAFFIRVLESAQAAIVLVNRGLELEASTILRSAFDSLIYLKCTIENEQFAYDYMHYAEIKGRDNLKTILDFKIYANDKRFGNESDVKKMISDFEDGFNEKRIKIGEIKNKFHRKELAKKADMSKMYATFYSVTSDDAHTGLGALSKHLKTDEHEKIVEIIHGPSDEEAIMHLIAAADFILLASDCVCELFKIKKNEEIEALHEKLKEATPEP